MARWDAAGDRRGIIRRIKRRMRVKGMSQVELARAIGFARSALSVNLDEGSGAWFSGEFLVRLPPALDCTADWLFYERGPETAAIADTNAASRDGYLRACDDLKTFVEEREAAARQKS